MDDNNCVKYEFFTSKIRMEMHTKKYKRAIETCKNYINEVSECDEKTQVNCYTMVYYNIAKCYLLIGDYENAMIYIKKFKELKQYLIPTIYGHALWLEARINDKLKRYDLSKKCYWMACKIYSQNGDNQFRLLMLTAISNINNNKECLRNLFYIYVEKYLDYDYEKNDISIEKYFNNIFVNDDEIKEYMLRQIDINALICA